jgi:DNA-binding IscR family transcriptional regulator
MRVKLISVTSPGDFSLASHLLKKWAPVKSTKLVTACYIMSFIGAHQPRMLATATIAKWVDTHAARARQIVAPRVKAGLFDATRGGGGGVKLARRPNDITLLDIDDASTTPRCRFFRSIILSRSGPITAACTMC